MVSFHKDYAYSYHSSRSTIVRLDTDVGQEAVSWLYLTQKMFHRSVGLQLLHPQKARNLLAEANETLASVNSSLSNI